MAVDHAEVTRYPSAVLTALDNTGHPFSIRCRPVPDGDTYLLDRAHFPELEAGPASLSAHSHNERMWDLRELVVTGRLEPDADRLRFRPGKVIPGSGYGGVTSEIRFVIRSRRRAARYLRARGLSRPRVDWDHVAGLHRQASAEGEHPGPHQLRTGLPEDAEATVRSFRTAELTTMRRDGTPITFPIVPFYDPDEGTFYSLGSIGYPVKNLRMRNDPRVSLLLSDPTGSGLSEPAAVLVQGDASSPDQILVPGEGGIDHMFVTVFRRQPDGIIKALSNPVSRWLMDWYMMRLPFSITPRRILVWPASDFTRPPVELSSPSNRSG